MCDYDERLGCGIMAYDYGVNMRLWCAFKVYDEDVRLWWAGMMCESHSAIVMCDHGVLSTICKADDYGLRILSTFLRRAIKICALKMCQFKTKRSSQLVANATVKSTYSPFKLT